MMLLFLVEEQVFTFFYDFKEVNIDLGYDVFMSISCLSIGQQYTIEGGACGNTTVRRVGYEIVNNQCIVGDRVFRVLPNGDVDFPVDQDCEELASTSPNYVCESIKPYAFAIYSAEDLGFLACVRGERLRNNMPIEYVQGYTMGKFRSTDNYIATGWIDIGYVVVPSWWVNIVCEDEIIYYVDEKIFTKVYFGSHADCRNLEDLYFVADKLYSMWDEGYFCLSLDEISKVFKKAS